MNLKKTSILCFATLFAIGGYLNINGQEAFAIAESSKLGDIVKNDDGSVRYMNQWNAEEYCKSKGGLPTARLLAMEAKRLGAKGIRETKYPDAPFYSGYAGAFLDETFQTEIAENEKDGYQPIYSNNSHGVKTVYFYYNSDGYQRPADETERYFFWSSSLHPNASSYAYGLGDDQGHLYDKFRGFSHYEGDFETAVVRCMR